MNIKALLKGSFAISLGTIAAGALSYIYSAAMGRSLGPIKFGDLGAITSFLVIATSVSTAISTISMHYSGHLLARGHVNQVQRLHRRLTGLTLIGSAILMAISLLLTPLIVKTFSISDSRALYIASLTIVITFILAINKGILQGAQKFWTITFINIIEVGTKLVMGILLVKAGLSLTGATIALVLSGLASYATTTYFLRGTLAKTANTIIETPDDLAEDTLDKKEFLSYFLPTVLSTILLLLLMNMDTVLVKYFFSPDQAGKYIAVATIAKIIFFITGPISLVMFPLITEQRAKGEKHYQTLGLSLTLTIIGSTLILFVYYLFSKKITTLLYGNTYAGLETLLPLVSVFVIFTSLVNLMSQYFMSVRKFFFTYLMAFCLIVLAVLASRHHSTIHDLVSQFIIATALLFLLMMIYYLVMKRSQIAEKLGAKLNGSS